MRARVYIDGFNLYYRALKGTRHKWLDLAALSDAVMPTTVTVEAVNYYAARVSGRVDARAPARQHAYLRAIETLDRVTSVFGRFHVSKKWAGLVQPPEFRPQLQSPLLDPISVNRRPNGTPDRRRTGTPRRWRTSIKRVLFALLAA